MSRKKTVVILLIVIATAAIGITYGTIVLNSQTGQPSTSTANCGSEDVVGNFTSSPQMSGASSGPYNLTFYIQNLASQSATITEYTDNNGLTQSVNWVVPASTTGSFQTMIYRTENSLMLETPCGTFFTAYVYYPSTVHHYEVTLFVSLGGAAS